MRSVHRHAVTVRFGDCDPAAIAYFPRIFDWFHQAMESWFEQCLEVPYASVIQDQHLGFPAVSTHAQFKAPCRFGDELAVELRVEQVGASSFTLTYRVVGQNDDILRATGTTKVVTVVLPDIKPVALPTALRDRIVAYRLDTTPPEVQPEFAQGTIDADFK